MKTSLNNLDFNILLLAKIAPKNKPARNTTVLTNILKWFVSSKVTEIKKIFDYSTEEINTIKAGIKKYPKDILAGINTPINNNNINSYYGSSSPIVSRTTTKTTVKWVPGSDDSEIVIDGKKYFFLAEIEDTKAIYTLYDVDTDVHYLAWNVDIETFKMDLFHNYGNSWTSEQIKQIESVINSSKTLKEYVTEEWEEMFGDGDDDDEESWSYDVTKQDIDDYLVLITTMESDEELFSVTVDAESREITGVMENDSLLGWIESDTEFTSDIVDTILEHVNDFVNQSDDIVYDETGNPWQSDVSVDRDDSGYTVTFYGSDENEDEEINIEFNSDSVTVNKISGYHDSIDDLTDEMFNIALKALQNYITKK